MTVMRRNIESRLSSKKKGVWLMPNALPKHKILNYFCGERRYFREIPLTISSPDPKSSKLAGSGTSV